MARLVLQPLDLLLPVALVLPLSWLMGGLGGLLVGWELPLALPCAALVAAVGVLVTLGKALRLSERLGERLLLTWACGWSAAGSPPRAC
jgi:hypothetical protein